jgi:hypothetical protein
MKKSVIFAPLAFRHPRQWFPIVVASTDSVREQQPETQITLAKVQSEILVIALQRIANRGVPLSVHRQNLIRQAVVRFSPPFIPCAVSK